MIDALGKLDREAIVDSQLLCEQVDLVQNDNVRDILEPSIVPESLEDLQRISKRVFDYARLRLNVVSWAIDCVNNAVDFIEVLDPFSSVPPIAWQICDLELCI